VAATINGYTLEEAQTELARWKGTLASLASSQSYGIGQRNLLRVKADEAERQIKKFAAIVTAFTGAGTAGARVIRAVPRDT
jgi:hypothetical protein